jgi:UDP-N-acetylmuramoyl-tripeptide--D-alanyl-D-alanine ligase
MMDTATDARAVHGRMLGANVQFARVATDTRTLAPGDLFVAIKGERFDGHDFVGAAFERGAAAALVAANRAGGLTGNLIAVPDSLGALGALAAHWRARFTIPVIVIVGSNGKTTVKEMLAAILRAHYGDARVLATEGNLNNAIGLPLTLLRLRAGHEVAAIELGMNHPGETAELAAIAQPTVALINNAQREHQEFMRSIAEVAAEHAALVGALPAGGTAVLNADDPNIDVWRAAVRARTGLRTIEFALDHPAAIRLRGVLVPSGGPVAFATPVGDARHGSRRRGATTWRMRSPQPRRRSRSESRSRPSCAASRPFARSRAASSRCAPLRAPR